MEYALELKGLTKKIKDKTIVNKLSFGVKKGEVFGFLGPNGAGKTTTIRMIVGLIGITEGDVLVEGKSMKTNKIEGLKQIGAIVENPELYPYLTAIQNLRYFSRMYDNVSEERIMKVVKLVKLENALNQKVGTYSLGMRQRLGIAVALLHNPKILILDEPTNGLDPAGIKELREYLKELAHKDNIAVVVSSHMLSEVELMCDRVGIVQKGELVKTVDLNNRETSYTWLKIEADNLEVAKVLLKEKIKGIDVEIEDQILKVKTEKKDVPMILKVLLYNDIEVYNASFGKESLENIFLDLTGGAVYGR
ncbi:ABC transporter ATP-binding protein [Clostridium cellulovorans]|uniref:ABC transporter related n=1 Tax=Clostridium cellulovorans (strain ATCC 35296 / DSM 3052 / OCM 3 / 743B) TaxID=573061 RepID=D9SWB5_CLOC7|nr:ABC transporter ATP-binding protein [Clostridium cellulovorans]ADL51259.1 ABC transporter related [Clostridium cellulovorans 743B]